MGEDCPLESLEKLYLYFCNLTHDGNIDFTRTPHERVWNMTRINNKLTDFVVKIDFLPSSALVRRLPHHSSATLRSTVMKFYPFHAVDWNIFHCVLTVFHIRPCGIHTCVLHRGHTGWLGIGLGRVGAPPFTHSVEEWLLKMCDMLCCKLEFH